MNPFVIAFAALRRNLAGSLALSLVVALAIAIGVGVMAQERAIRKGSARAADGFDLLIGAPGSQTQLVLTTTFLQEAALPLMPGEILNDLKAKGGATWFAPLAFGDSDKGRAIVGTTIDFVTRGGKVALAEGAVFAKEDEAVVGADAGLKLGESFVPTHGHSSAHGENAENEIKHESHVYRVVGRLPRSGTPWDRAILVPVESVWETHGLPNGHRPGDERIGPPFDGEKIGGIPAIVVKAASVADAYRLRGLYRTGGATMAVFPAEVLVDLYATMADVRDAMTWMALATQVLVLLAILVAVFAIFAGRKRQIAVLRALGAPKLFVFSALWLEVAVIVVVGALLGLAVGYGASSVFSWLAELRLGFALPVSLGVEELRMTLATVLVGLLLAILPAVIAYRQPVAAALKG